QAFALGGPLGHLLSRSFELITTVVRDGICDDMSIGYVLESLAMERELAAKRDHLKDDPLRQLVYGLTEGLGTLVESMME
ncbi:hypothetical protein PMAYCL1PPCAC_01617, partial [Pristionchus mayeri]